MCDKSRGGRNVNRVFIARVTLAPSRRARGERECLVRERLKFAVDMGLGGGGFL